MGKVLNIIVHGFLKIDSKCETIYFDFSFHFLKNEIMKLMIRCNTNMENNK